MNFRLEIDGLPYPGRQLTDILLCQKCGFTVSPDRTEDHAETAHGLDEERIEYIPLDLEESSESGGTNEE